MASFVNRHSSLNRSEEAAGRTTFAELLRRVHDEVPQLPRLRFVTSYPRDFTDEALEVMAASPRICKYLHIPAQSGSNEVLKRMNRGYTVEQYTSLLDRARGIMPDVAIAGGRIDGDIRQPVLCQSRCDFHFIDIIGPVHLDMLEPGTMRGSNAVEEGQLRPEKSEIGGKLRHGHGLPLKMRLSHRSVHRVHARYATG